MVKIKWLKDYKERKMGDISEAASQSAKNFVEQGYAEFVTEEILQETKNENNKLIFDNLQLLELQEKNPEKDIQKIYETHLSEAERKAFPDEEITEVYSPGLEESLRYINPEIREKRIAIEKERAEWSTNEFGELVKIIDKDGNVIKPLPKKEEFLLTKISRNGKEVVLGIDIDKVSDFLISEHNFTTIYGNKSDIVFTYNGKIHITEGRGIIKSETEKLLGEYAKRNVVDEVFEKIKRRTKGKREDFEKTDIDLLPLNNGVLSISKKELLAYQPYYNFKKIIPIDYKKDSSCPNWIKFLNESLYPEDIPTAQEWFGFQLYREYFIKKGLICLGAQDTGKSVFLDTIIAFVGEENKTGLSLQKITSGSDFVKLSLKDKLANVYDDLSSKDLSDGGAFKVATGGGYISAEEKFGDYSQFKSYAKQTFATNKIPSVKDNDDLAYFGRWIVFRFDNVPEIKDPFLRKKLHTPEEMSGILNWALEGLYRLLEKGSFSYSKTPQEVKQIMESSGNPLVLFGLDVLEKQDESIITKDEMFRVYSAWCEETKKPRQSKEMLGRQLEKFVPYIIADKHKERIWKNAKFKGKWSEILENLNNSPKTDTSDTSKNIMRTYGERANSDNHIGNIISQEVSDVVKEQEDLADTSDTSKEELNFEGLDL